MIISPAESAHGNHWEEYIWGECAPPHVIAERREITAGNRTEQRAACRGSATTTFHGPSYHLMNEDESHSARPPTEPAPQGQPAPPPDDKKKEAPPDGKPEGPPKPPWYKRPLLAGAVVLAVLVLLVGGTLLWLHSRTYESTDDAFIDILPQQVSSQVAGRVLRVLVDDNQDVAAGQLLVELDPATFTQQQQGALAAAARAEAQVAQAVAQKDTYIAQAEQAGANLDVARTNFDNTNKDLTRFRELRSEDAGAVSQQQLDHAIAANDSARAQVSAAQKTVEAARSLLQASDSAIAAARAGIRSAAAETDLANINLSYTRVAAVVAGRVAKKSTAPGDYITAGTMLMAIVPRDVYVTANFKETQLARMLPRQRVEVHVDAYPDLKLTGEVASVQPGTGQVFSELPAQNATGNWVKVVQRVPVKIILDPYRDDPDRRLGPGMSVEVRVSVR